MLSGSPSDVAQQVRAALARPTSLVRVIDLLRQMDDDNSGMVERAEWYKVGATSAHVLPLRGGGGGSRPDQRVGAHPAAHSPRGVHSSSRFLPCFGLVSVCALLVLPNVFLPAATGWRQGRSTLRPAPERAPLYQGRHFLFQMRRPGPGLPRSRVLLPSCSALSPV